MSCELHITSYHIYMDQFESIYVLRERDTLRPLLEGHGIIYSPFAFFWGGSSSVEVRSSIDT